MSEIARAAGLAKGALYLYFATREELFLSVFQQHVRVWFDEMETTLAVLDRYQ